MGINIQHRPAPKEIRAQFDAVILREVTPERKEELSLIAHRLSDSFIEVLGTAAGEDDCIEPFHDALSSMDHRESLTFPRKAGIVSELNPCMPLYSLYLEIGD